MIICDHALIFNSLRSFSTTFPANCVIYFLLKVGNAGNVRSIHIIMFVIGGRMIQIQVLGLMDVISRMVLMDRAWRAKVTQNIQDNSPPVALESCQT